MVRPLDLAYLPALVAASPWLAYRADCAAASIRRGARVRHSSAPRRLPPPKRPRAWFHGVSVGEIHLLRQVVAALPPAASRLGLRRLHHHRHRPRRGAGAASATCRSSLAARFLLGGASGRLRPCSRAVVLAEGELWPNLLRAARRRGVPVAVINGRMSPRSARRYRRSAPRPAHAARRRSLRRADRTLCAHAPQPRRRCRPQSRSPAR